MEVVVTSGSSKTENDGPGSICWSTMIAVFTSDPAMLVLLGDSEHSHSVSVDAVERFESSKPLAKLLRRNDWLGKPLA